MENDSTEALKDAIRVDEAQLRGHIDEAVRSSVEETLNALLEAEADQICRAQRYERSPERVDTRAGHYERGLETKAGEVTLKVPKLRRLPFETAIIERYRRREASVEEALVEMYLAGVSVRRVEDITEALWGQRVSSGTVSRLNQKIYRHIEAWRNREIAGQYPYLYLDGVILKRSWAGEVRNVSVLVAIGIGSDGYRQILGVAEGEKEDLEGWRGFLRQLKDRGLAGAQLIISDACRGLVEAAAELFPEANWQRCVVHFYRNVFSHVPNGKVAEVARMLKAIHAQEDRKAAQAKANEVVARLKEMKLRSAAELVEQKVNQTLVYYAFPSTHWRQIRTNNPLERIIREIRRRTRVVGAFPDGHSALMLVAARLRHIAATKWGKRRYLVMEALLNPAKQEAVA
ncbi:MAG TPA: IS256 family transposase [Longimicrobiales bacterium]|nr:IS256 family transposase [Longimicrobiales bacterium]